MQLSQREDPLPPRPDPKVNLCVCQHGPFSSVPSQLITLTFRVVSQTAAMAAALYVLPAQQLYAVEVFSIGGFSILLIVLGIFGTIEEFLRFC